MATQTVSNFDAMYKDTYLGPVVEMLNQKTYLIDMIERETDKEYFTGRRVIVPVHSGRNRGRGALAGDTGTPTLPTAGRQNYQDAIFTMREHYQALELSDLVIEQSKKGEGSFARALTEETERGTKDLRKDINREAYGTGDGLLGTCASASSGVVTMNSKYDLQYIAVGDTVDIVVKSTGATTAGVLATQVTARSVSGTTITVSPAPTTPGSIDTTYGVYVAGNRNNEMDGLRNIISTGRTLHSINSSTAGNEFWDANVINAGSSLSALATAGESLFEQLADQIGDVGNGDTTVFLTSRGVRRRLADTYQSQKRFNDANAVKIHGGYSAIMVNEIPVVSDDDCPKTNVFALDSSALKWFELAPVGFLEANDGEIWQLKTASSGQYQAVRQAWIKWYAALGSVAPNRLGRIQFANDDAPKTNNL